MAPRVRRVRQVQQVQLVRQARLVPQELQVQEPPVRPALSELQEQLDQLGLVVHRERLALLVLRERLVLQERLALLVIGQLVNRQEGRKQCVVYFLQGSIH